MASPLPPAGPCTFAFGAPYYLSFDLTPLRGQVFSRAADTGPMQGLPYTFTLCAVLPAATCPPPASTASSMQLDEAGTTCVASFGVATSASAAVLAEGEGLLLTYAGGAATGPGEKNTASTSFALRCDPALAPGALVVESLGPAEDGVNLAYAARSGAACGAVVPRVVAPLGVGWLAFLAVAGAVAAYFVGGTLYNRRVKGARGVEALPHIERMRGAWAAVRARLGGGGGQAGAAAYGALASGEEEGEGGGGGAGGKLDGIMFAAA